MAKKVTRKVGVLTAGSDCPGLNAAIRAIGKALQRTGEQEVVGFQDGFRGLMEDRTLSLGGNALSNILTTGGTILGTSRDRPEGSDGQGSGEERTDRAIATYERHNLEALVCIGGHETQASALHLARHGLNVVMVPKAIDNDVQGTDRAVGFDSAMEVGAQAIDRLHSTAHSLHRIVIVELMGRNTGWLALGAGVSSGADVILIPEIPYNLEKITAAIQRRNRDGKSFSIIAVSERVTSLEEVAFQEQLRKINAQMRSGAERDQVDAHLNRPDLWHSDSTFHIANRLRELTAMETRITILGYLLRGGAPTAVDRLLATHLGTAAAGFVQQRRFGVMAALRGSRIEPVPLDEVTAGHKCVPLDHPWIESARLVGTSLGD
jgi:6-phosphofructokinase 1